MIINNKIKQGIGENWGKPKHKERQIIEKKIRQHLDKIEPDKIKYKGKKKKQKKYLDMEIGDIVIISEGDIVAIDDEKVKYFTFLKNCADGKTGWLSGYLLMKIIKKEYLKNGKPVYYGEFIDILEYNPINLELSKLEDNFLKCANKTLKGKVIKFKTDVISLLLKDLINKLGINIETREGMLQFVKYVQESKKQLEKQKKETE